jgi:two-component system KDP operon response regulator KdpE
VRVLLIDDDSDMASDLELLLAPDIDLVWAADTQDAISRLAGHEPPEAIVLDLCLPLFLSKTEECEGLELLTALRKDLAPDVPVIVLSSMPAKQIEAECLRRGARAYLEKPYRIEDLKKELSRVHRAPTTDHGSRRLP